MNDQRSRIAKALREEAARSWLFKWHWNHIAAWIERGEYLVPVGERKRP